MSVKSNFDRFRGAMQKSLKPIWGTMRLVVEAHGDRHESPGQWCLVTFEVREGGEIANHLDRTLSFKAERSGTAFLEFRDSAGDFIYRHAVDDGRGHAASVREDQTVTATSRTKL